MRGKLRSHVLIDIVALHNHNFCQVATADHFESRSEDEDEYDLGEMETEAEEERDIFEMPLISSPSVIGRAHHRPGWLAYLQTSLYIKGKL